MEAEDLLSFLQKNWRSGWGLLTGWGLGLLMVGYLIPDAHLIARSTLAVIVILGVWVLWWFGRQPPKTKKGRAGIAVCIDAGSTPASQNVRNYFVRTMRNLIKRGRARERLDVLVVPDHIAPKIVDFEKAQALRKKMRAHFLLYGNVSLGNHGGKPTYFLRMVGVVVHRQLDDDVKGALAREFTELLPQNVNIDAGIDLTGVEIISQWTDLSAKYVLALAAALSGALDFAAELFTDVITGVAGVGSFPAIDKIRERAPQRLARVNAVRAGLLHRTWVDSKDPEVLNQFGALIDAIPDELAAEAGATFGKAIWAFVGARDVDRALGFVEGDRHEGEPAWHFSRAFLYAYQGDLKRATQSYQKIAKLDIKNPDVFTQVEEFLYWLLAAEPNKFEIYYCLGVIAHRIKGDKAMARKEFREFLRLCSPEQFQKDREIVEAWLREIEAVGDSAETIEAG